MMVFPDKLKGMQPLASRSSTWSTSCPLGTSKIVMSLAWMACMAESAAVIPLSSSAWRVAGVRQYTLTDIPAFCRLRAIGSPMTPIPMTPIFMITSDARRSHLLVDPKYRQARLSCKMNLLKQSIRRNRYDRIVGIAHFSRSRAGRGNQQGGDSPASCAVQHHGAGATVGGKAGCSAVHPRRPHAATFAGRQSADGLCRAAARSGAASVGGHAQRPATRRPAAGGDGKH